MNGFDISFFDTVNDRHAAGDIKYRPVRGIDDVIPMWIADMDFKAPPRVQEALHQAVDYGIYGYMEKDRTFDEAVIGWYRGRLSWEIRPEWLFTTMNVMSSISASIRALTEEGDSVLICQPVYFPFERVISANRRRPVISQLRLRNGRYAIDFADFEERIRSQKVKVFLLCSPHNPVCRVWTKEELTVMAEICLKYGVYIISDEIHCDFVYEGHSHTPIAALSEETAAVTITCTAPSKTFNLAGLQLANMIISEAELLKKVKDTFTAAGYTGPNTMAMAAAKAAYLYGEPWLDALLAYLHRNIRILKDFCDSSGGKISLIPPEGTYLMWLDCRGLGMSDEELKTFFLKKCRVWLHGGPVFGAGGNGFMRMNIACPASVLKTALERIGAALK